MYMHQQVLDLHKNLFHIYYEIYNVHIVTRLEKNEFRSYYFFSICL